MNRDEAKQRRETQFLLRLENSLSNDKLKVMKRELQKCAF